MLRCEQQTYDARRWHPSAVRHYWPGRIKPGIFEQPAIQLDLHATALAAASVDAWDEANVDPLWGGGNAGGKKQATTRSGKKKRKNAQ